MGGAKMFSPHNFKTTVKFSEGLPSIVITEKAFNTMWHIVDQSSEEVGWLGIVNREGSMFFIEEILLFEQEVSAGTCEISPDGLAKVTEELIAAHPDDPELLNKIRFWGHSHVNMGTSSSTQDDDQMEEFAENGCEYFIRAILNKNGRMEFTVFLYEEGIEFSDCEWSVCVSKDDELGKEVAKELEEKVTSKVYNISTYRYPNLKGGKVYGGKKKDIGYWRDGYY